MDDRHVLDLPGHVPKALDQLPLVDAPDPPDLPDHRLEQDRQGLETLLGGVV